MTAFKRSCALVLALVMVLAALPGTVFAVSDTAGEASASLTPMEETSLDDIASDVAKQVLRGDREKDGKLEIESAPEYDENDEVEIIVVVDNATADPNSRSQIRALLRR